jgi:hypothetical protein
MVLGIILTSKFIFFNVKAIKQIAFEKGKLGASSTFLQ